jgi:hypothetical protein
VSDLIGCVYGFALWFAFVFAVVKLIMWVFTLLWMIRKHPKMPEHILRNSHGGQNSHEIPTCCVCAYADYAEHGPGRWHLLHLVQRFRRKSSLHDNLLLKKCRGGVLLFAAAALLATPTQAQAIDPPSKLVPRHLDEMEKFMWATDPPKIASSQQRRLTLTFQVFT